MKYSINSLTFRRLVKSVAVCFLIFISPACSSDDGMRVEQNLNGQYVVYESEKPVLQYNYQTVYEKDVIRPESRKNKKIEYFPIEGVYVDEYYKANPAVSRDGKATSAIWAIPRSDYIHPLYGLNGEMLTDDWPDAAHPHHRGIFWAWPEVEYGSQRGDIYALQRVFARPAGKIKCSAKSGYAEIVAENKWMWEDREAIVLERVTIRAYKASNERRIIDLAVEMRAIKDSITLATRFTNSYGGLNVRMAAPANQTISYGSCDAGTNAAAPEKCWSDFCGIFEGETAISGMAIVPHSENPEYPGKWVEYPNLSWVQPTFPTPNTRYPLSKNRPLILRYRLIVHSGNINSIKP